MKKNRLLSFALLICVLSTLILPISASAEGQTPSPSPSQAAATPSVQGQSAILDAMHIQAKAAILVDDDNQEILYEQGAREKNYPASITKVMTTLLAIEAIDRGEHSLDELVTVGNQVDLGIGAGGSGVGLKEGEQLRLEDLLYCALTASANEACNALAQFISGDVASFVALMNQRAAELGMADTHFANTHGYHDENHYTTAYDIYLMCHEAMKHPTFRTIVSSKAHTVPATNLHAERNLHETNALVSTWRITGYWYEYATGIKTGSTPEAGYCLSSSATKDGKTLIAVVLGAENPKNPDGSTNRLQFSESRRLLKWGFDNFSRKTLLDKSAMDFPEVGVSLSAGANYVTVQPGGSLEATLPNDIDLNAFQRQVDLPEQVEAPIQVGQKLGTVTLTYNNHEYGSLDLVATSSVDRSELLYRLDRIQAFFDQLWVKLVLIAVVLLMLILVIRRIFFGKQKNRYGSSRSGSRSRSSYSGRRRR